VSLPPSYFDQLYEDRPDPWSLRTRWYEARKRDITLAALPSARYATAFEPGCSVGLLTTGLAVRCDRVLAMDVSAAALEQARPTLPTNVELRIGSVPGDWPEHRYDLVILSELAYYLDGPDCEELARQAVSSGGDVLAVHWRHHVDEYPLAGDTVNAIIAEAARQMGMRGIVEHVEDDFRLQVWSRDPRSVARRTGVIDP
jgi:trans-aconitate methyltransferase